MLFFGSSNVNPSIQKENMKKRSSYFIRKRKAQTN